MEFAHQHDVLPDAQIGINIRVFRDDADVLAGRNRLGNDVAAGHAGGAAGRRDVAGKHPNRRALAGTIWTEKAEDFATADRKVDVIDRDALAVMAGQPIGLDDRLCRHGGKPIASGPCARLIWIMGCQIS